MAKIKVNELTQQTPTLNDTIVASGEAKEYACKVDDLKTLIGRKEIYQDFTDHVTFAAGQTEAYGTSRIKELVSYCFEEGMIPTAIYFTSTDTSAFPTIGALDVVGEAIAEDSSYRYGILPLRSNEKFIAIDWPTDQHYLRYSLLQAASASFELDVTIRCRDFLSHGYLETYEVYLFENDGAWEASRTFSDTFNAWNEGEEVYFNFWYNSQPYHLRATFELGYNDFKAIFGDNGTVEFNKNNYVAITETGK